MMSKMKLLLFVAFGFISIYGICMKNDSKQEVIIEKKTNDISGFYYSTTIRNNEQLPNETLDDTEIEQFIEKQTDRRLRKREQCAIAGIKRPFSSKIVVDK